MYHYLSNERLQFSFPPQNVCAAFLVITALLTDGAFLVVVWRGSNVMDLIRWSKKQVFISTIAMGLFFFALAGVMLMLIR